MTLGSCPRPKILTEVVVPTGGWAIDFDISIGAELDTALTATLPAGTYYLAWDAQSDDLLYQLNVVMQAEIDTADPGGGKYLYIRLNSDNKVQFVFAGAGFAGAPDYAVRIEFSTGSADLAAALGYTTDYVSTGSDNPVATADYQHAYGWYADRSGQLETLSAGQWNKTESQQAVSYGGRIKTVQLGERFGASLSLNHLDNGLTWSHGVSYGSDVRHPIERNVPLECWFREAAQGKKFRVYREGRNDTGSRVDVGVNTTGTTDGVVSVNKVWSTTPAEHLNMVCHIVSRFGDDNTARFMVASVPISNKLNAPNVPPDGLDWCDTAATAVFYIVPLLYDTYVLDVQQMDMWEPRELEQVDRYAVDIPLLRHET